LLLTFCNYTLKEEREKWKKGNEIQTCLHTTHTLYFIIAF
jgi:hypothetical protein